jgi:U1 small nuclear ribonucleoprotein
LHPACAEAPAAAAQTIFVGRLSYDVSESKLRREFDAYGPIKSLRLVHDSVTDKPRGYAFVEYHSQHDMKTAYKAGDAKKLEGRRCVVDVERGRTVPGWRPRRLGGGLGGTRLGGKLANVVLSGRDAGARAGAPALDDVRAERPRERERAPVPRGDTRPGADRERPRELERSRDRSRDRERRRSRSREPRRSRSRGALLRRLLRVPSLTAVVAPCALRAAPP